jgi:hypothetical protein
MADTPNPAFDADDIGKLFNKAKTSGEAYSFAFGLASKPEECGLVVHLRKPPATLKKDLKKASSAVKKVCFGTFTVDGPDVRFLVEKPIKGLVAQLKKRFREAGMGKYRPMLVGPDGAEIDEDSLPDDDGPDEDDAADDAATPDAAEAPPVDTSALRERLVRVKAGIEAAPKDRIAQLTNAFTATVALDREGKVEDAGAALGRIEKALAVLSSAAPPPAPPALPPSPDAAARLSAALAQMVPRIHALPAGPAQTETANAARNAQALIAKGDFAGAAQAMRALSDALTRAESPPPNAPPRQSPLDIWNAAKEVADADITRLQTFLRGFGHPDTTRIAEFGLSGLSGGGDQTALIRALMVHAQTSGPDRAAAAKAVVKAVADYRSFLATNQRVALCEANPFGVPVNLRGCLGGALDQIETALAA